MLFPWRGPAQTIPEKMPCCRLSVAAMRFRSSRVTQNFPRLVTIALRSRRKVSQIFACKPSDLPRDISSFPGSMLPSFPAARQDTTRYRLSSLSIRTTQVTFASRDPCPLEVLVRKTYSSPQLKRAVFTVIERETSITPLTKTHVENTETDSSCALQSL